MKTKASVRTDMENLHYKGLVGTISVDLKEKRLHGHVIGTSDKIVYEGATIEELENDFRESVDEYIELCRELGKEPERSFSGKILLRATPEMHGLVAQQAQKCGKSINTWLIDIVKEAIDQDHCSV